MASDTKNRDLALRRLLVAEASSRARRVPWGPIIASVAAVALVGGIAIGATLFGGRQPFAPVGDTPTHIMPSFITSDSVIIGTPMVAEITSEAAYEAGPLPENATSLGIAVRCLEPGEYDIEIDGDWQGGGSCDEALGGTAGYWTFDPDGPNLITVTPTARIVVWVVWVDVPAEPDLSEEQKEALADGEVTREEYVAAFDRFAACMSAEGYDISGNRDLEIIQYSLSSDAVSSGSDQRCYIAEFQEVDMTWQVEHPQQSAEQQTALVDGVVTRDEYLAGFARYADCLAALGADVLVDDFGAAVLSYDVEAGPELSGEAGRCYRFEFFQIETAWKASVPD